MDKKRSAIRLMLGFTVVFLILCGFYTGVMASGVESQSVNFRAATAGGTVTAMVDNTEITSGTQVPRGKEVVFTAKPDTGYQFKGWSMNGSPFSPNPLKVPVTERDINLAVSFELIPLDPVVIFSVNGSHGTLSASVSSNGDKGLTTGDTVAKGDDVQFTARPEAGYRVQSWIQNGTAIAGHKANSYLIKDIQSNVTVNVSFEPIPEGEPTAFTVTYSIANGRGQITAKADGRDIASGTLVDRGRRVAFLAVPMNGYGIKEWKVNGISVDLTGASIYTILALEEDADVTVELELLPTTITAIYIDPDDAEVLPGQTARFQALSEERNLPVQSEWSIRGNTSVRTKIENGFLTVGEDETATDLTITAIALSDRTMDDSIRIDIGEHVQADLYNNEAYNITNVSAYLSGEALINGDYRIEETGFVYSDTEEYPSLSNSPSLASDNTEGGEFFCYIYPLVGGREYFYRSYAVTSSGVVIYADDVDTFVTDYPSDPAQTEVTGDVPEWAAASVMSVSNESFDGLTENSVILHGMLEDAGFGEDVIREKGFAYSDESAMPLLDHSAASHPDVFGGGYSLTVNKLKPGTVYYYRAYTALLSGEVIYADEAGTFTTGVQEKPDSYIGDYYVDYNMLGTVTDGDSALEAVRNAVNGISVSDRANPEAVNDITLFAEAALSKGTAQPLKMFGGALTYSSFSGAVSEAERVREGILEIFRGNGINLNRAFNTELCLISETGLNLNLILTGSMSGLPADSVRIECPGSAVIIGKDLLTALSTGGQLLVNVEPYYDDILTYRVSFGRTPEYPVTLSLPIEGGGVYATDGNGMAIAGVYNPATGDMEINVSADGVIAVQ